MDVVRGVKTMAEEHKLPTRTQSLYELSVCAVADKFLAFKKCLAYLPENLVFDLYYQLYKEERLCLMEKELCNLNTFSTLLNVTTRRVQLLQCFQALFDHSTGICTDLIFEYNLGCLNVKNDLEAQEFWFNLGLRLAGFFNDGGWFVESEKVLQCSKDLCLSGTDGPQNWRRILDCCKQLLHAQAEYYNLPKATQTYELALKMLKKLEAVGYMDTNHAVLYSEFSFLFFIRSEYDQAYRWSMEALKHLRPTLHPRIIIDVLCNASKACVIKREFQKAGLLSKQAVYLARKIYGDSHPKYSDVLFIYGFYLLNFDCVLHSVNVYKKALEIRQAIFGQTNLYVAAAHEDLAYALYVHEYNSGKFNEASNHINKAIEIIAKLLPEDNLMLASAKRVKALILEEVALDSAPTPIVELDLLTQSESLHLSALQLAKSSFGERNVQTAKHYGNLGRLYQSMRKYEQAEEMHLRAIRIKEELLGPDDYEVGLSIGHLASLYNFHMSRFEDAEALYYRSITIGIKLFGKSYSGLEYDYRGLIHVYNKLDMYEKVVEYNEILSHWRELRDKHAAEEVQPIDLSKGPDLINDVINAFFAM